MRSVTVGGRDDGRASVASSVVDVRTAQLFFALLTLVANVGAVALLVLRRTSLPAAVAPWALWLAWAVALTSTLGSLYFSEVANFTPCTLCWYQRIAMYPLAVVLLVAAVVGDRGVRRYALPVIGVGGAISIYHVLLERFPDLDAGACSATVPCTLVWFREFGFVTLPYMALSGFALIAVLLTLPHVAPSPTTEATP